MRRDWQIWLGVAFLACAVCIAMTGCTRYQQFLTDPVARQFLAQDFGDAIRIGLIAADPEDAKCEAARITRIATQVKLAAQGDLTTGDFRSVITDLVIQRLEPQDRPRARIIVELIFSRIHQRFNVDLTLVPADIAPLTRDLIVQLCDEAISAAAPYVTT